MPTPAPRRFRIFRLPWRTRQQVISDIDEELEFHLQMRTRELIDQGLSPVAARQRAEESFGDVGSTKRYMRRVDMQLDREQRWSERFDDLQQDVRYALRALGRNRAFTVVAVLTLALGIGANTAIFSVVNGVLLKPLPFPHPEQLVRIYDGSSTEAPQRGPASAVDVDDWRAQRSVIADFGGYWYAEGQSGTDLTGEGEPQRLSAAYVTPGFFNTLGLGPELGRLPRDEEMVRGSNDHVVTISHAFWMRQFAGSKAVIGKRVALGGESYEIVGVMHPEFRFPSSRVEIFIPFSTIPDEATPRIRPVRILGVIGRAKPGVSVERVSAEMNAITKRLAEVYPNENKNWDAASVESLHDSIVGSVRRGLFVLLGAVGFVLLLASVNLASLLLARATARGREIAIRGALGASRRRLIRQLMTESMVLALIGGVAGLGVAQLGTKALLALSAGQIPRTDTVGLDGSVLVFSLVASVVTGLLFGSVPAFRVSSPRLQESLREGSRGSTIGGAQRLRNGLVVVEVALAVILVVGAGLMAKSFVRLLQVDLGFQPQHRVAVNFTISSATHSAKGSREQYYRDVLDRVRAIPGVIAAGGIKDLPFRGFGEGGSFVPQGMPLGDPNKNPPATFLWVSDDFFRAMGVPIVAGREYTPADRPGTPLGFVVNKALADKYFPGQNAIGKRFSFGDTTWYPIIGVVGDVRQRAVDEPANPTIYVNVFRNLRVRVNLVVRTNGDPIVMMRRVKEAIWSIDKTQTMTAAFTLDEAVGEAVARPRLLAVLLGLFGAMGLVLGALGIYGVLAYLVSQRQREIGVRIALGAQRGDVLRMIVGRGLALGAGGVLLGLLGATLVTRFMQGVLYGVGTTDPLTFGGVAVALVGVAALASWLPARRASRVDPVVALREE